jgi:hypothetical protein
MMIEDDYLGSAGGFYADEWAGAYQARDQNNKFVFCSFQSETRSSDGIIRQAMRLLIASISSSSIPSP